MRQKDRMVWENRQDTKWLNEMSYASYTKHFDLVQTPTSVAAATAAAAHLYVTCIGPTALYP